MKTKNLGRVGAAVACSFILALVGGVSQAASNNENPSSEAAASNESELALSGEESLAVDVEGFAKDFGVSVEEIRRQIALQDQMDEIPFADLDPGYVEDGSQMGQEFKLIYRSVNEPSDQLIAALRQHGVEQSIHFERVKFTMRELLAARESAHRVMDTLGIQYMTDIQAGESSILVSTKLPLPESVRDKIRSVVGPVGVVWGDGVIEPVLAGGRAFAAGCTGGFIVRNLNTGRRGVSTAGHCPTNMNVYVGSAVNYRDHRCNGNHDVMWYANDNLNWEPAFYSRGTSGTEVRTQTGTQPWAQMDFGDPVAKNGITTGYKRGTVTSTTSLGACASSSTAQFVRVTPNAGEGDMSEPGDSGGPNFLGGEAYGVTSGQYGNDAVFYPISFATACSQSICVGVFTG